MEMVSEREIEAAIKAIEAVPIMDDTYSLSGEDAKAVARAALEAAARVRAEAAAESLIDTVSEEVWNHDASQDNCNVVDKDGLTNTGEPVAYRWRYRNSITNTWSNWIDGRGPEKPNPGDEIEEQALYTHPAPQPSGAPISLADAEKAFLDRVWPRLQNGCYRAHNLIPIEMQRLDFNEFVRDGLCAVFEAAASQPNESVCEGCQQELALDVHVPDPLWAKISPRPVEGYKGGGLLCPQCIVTRLCALTAEPQPSVKVKPLDEDDYEEIISAAAINMRKATSGIRGQVVTVQDSLDWWVMKETERRILSALTAGKPEQHPDDEAVDCFAAAMKAKLKWEREERGRYGWNDPEVCSEEYLAKLLIEHLAKGNEGNFEDIANFCMMLHQRGAHPRVLADALTSSNMEQECVTLEM